MEREMEEDLGQLDDDEFYRHLAQWLVDYQDAFLEYSPSRDADFVNYDQLYAQLIRFKNNIEKF